ncbi:hypothetical protein ACC779_07765 [Rhizobium ruizarguesonis]
MTGIRIYTKTGGPEVWYQTSTVGESLRHCGDDGLELILARMPVESFREAWRTEVLKTRDLMLARLAKPSGDIVDVMFDVSEGFYFQASHVRDREVVVSFKTALEALMIMPLTEQNDVVELVSLEDDEDIIMEGQRMAEAQAVFQKILVMTEESPTPNDDDSALNLMRKVEYSDRMRFKFAADITRNIEPEISRAVRLSVLEALTSVDNDINALKWPSREEMDVLSRKYSGELVDRMLSKSVVEAA